MRLKIRLGWLLAIVLIWAPGCVFVPCDCDDERDAWIRDDRGFDPGVGYDLPARDTGAWPDAITDTGPWTDTMQPDVARDLPPGDIGDLGPCGPVPSAEPFLLEVYGLPNTDGFYSVGTVFGDAVVTRFGDVEGREVPAREVVLKMLDDDVELGVVWDLGPYVRAPVSVGQKVQVYARQDWPWWLDVVVVLWAADGTPLFFAQDAGYIEGWFDCGGIQPCPTYHQVPDECPAVDGGCGTIRYPPIFMWLYGGLASSEPPIPLRQGQTARNINGVRYLVNRASVYEDMQCADVPNEWVTAAAMAAHQSDAMGCACEATSDCASHEVCETRLGRCVPDLCSAANHKGTVFQAGAACDPFRGQSGIDPTPLKPCTQDADCDPGMTSICNLEMRMCGQDGSCNEHIGGVCQVDTCQIDDCDSRFCSSLQFMCVNCLADCDCAQDGPGAFCDMGNCRVCNSEKIALTQENGGNWDFYELCVTGASPEFIEQALHAIDNTVSCGISGVFAQCGEGQIACLGKGMYKTSEHGMLDDASWARICALSMRDDVLHVVGGHYL